LKFEEAQTPHIGEDLPVCADEEVQEICPEDDGMGLIEVAKT